jgi:hypothetical protein
MARRRPGSREPRTNKVDDVASAWATKKSAGHDLTEVEKVAFEAARDSTKQLLALATGVIALTITFAKDYVGAGSEARWLALTAWGCLLASAFFGVWALNALTGNAQSVKPTTWLSTRSTNVIAPATLQVIAFVAGLVLTVIYAANATSAGGSQRLKAEADSLRRSAVRDLAAERLYWGLVGRLAARGSSPDSAASALLRRLSTGAAARASRSDSIIIGDTLLWSASMDSVANTIARAARQKGVVDGLAASAALSVCPLYPFC